MSKIKTDEINSKTLVDCLLKKCGIVEPPTEEQICFDFMRLKSDTFKVEDKQWSEGDPKIQGICAIDEKLILINEYINEDVRKRFTKFHELGHYLLPEHRKALYRCSWEDLSYWAQSIMERQANEFAANCLFQLNRFENESWDYKLGFESIITLKDRYRTSIESTARRYVERHYLPCSLVVYEPIMDPNNEKKKILQIQYTVKSNSFNYFHGLEEKQQVSIDSLEQQVFDKKTTPFSNTSEKIRKGTLSVVDERNSEVGVFPVECFTNSYKLLELVFPPVR